MMTGMYAAISGLDANQALLNETANNLAITLRKLRRSGDEFPLRIRVLDSTRRAVGPDHVDTFRAMIDLAQTQRHLGNHEMALDLFTEALGGLERQGEDQRTQVVQPDGRFPS